MTDKEKRKENKGEEKKEKKYKCKYPGCNASFDRSVDLARHVRVAHKRYPLKEEEKEKEKKEETEIETEAKREAETKEETKKEEEKAEEKTKEEIKKKEKEVEEEKAIPEEKPKSEIVEPEVPEGVKIKVQPSKPEIEVKTPPPERVDVTTIGVKPVQPAVPTPVVLQPSPSVTIVETEEYKRRVREVKDRYTPVLLKYPQVVGVGVNRMPDGRLGIEILTCAECPQKELPKTLEGIPTFVHGINELRLKPVTTPKPEPERKAKEGEEHAETLIDRIAYAKKFGIFFEGPVRKSLRKWLRRRREEKKKEREARR